MKKVLVFSIALLTSVYSFAFRAYFDYQVFHIPGEGSYVECITSFDGATFETIKNEEGKIRAAAELTLIFSVGKKIEAFKKVVVEGPWIAPGDKGDFMSLERIPLPNGAYDLEVTIKDVYNVNAQPETFNQRVKIEAPSLGAFFSDIQLVSAYTKTEVSNAFTKSGIDIIPYISNYYPTALNSLIFYAELYNIQNVLGENDKFAFVYSVLDSKGKVIDEYKFVKRISTGSVVPLLYKIDISALPTGNYTLQLIAQNKEFKNVITAEKKFTRNLVMEEELPVDQVLPKETLAATFVMKFDDRDSLMEKINCLLPIAKSQERLTIDNTLPMAEIAQMQSFFYYFWYKRNKENPEGAWLAYEEKVKTVQATFGTRIKKGWQTDRGRVYLQYGPPNTRAQRPNDPDYWPFEIWHYYETNDGLHDRRFLFINTNLGQDYELLHSDVPWETQNNDWKLLVRSRSMNTPGTVNRNTSTQMTTRFNGDELEDLWYNPY